MNRENLLYLHKLSKRSQLYFDIRKQAIDYIAENHLFDNKELCVSLLLISALWAANKNNEHLTEDDLIIFFSLESTGDDFVSQPMTLSDEHKHLTLKELQDITVQTFQS